MHFHPMLLQLYIFRAGRATALKTILRLWLASLFTLLSGCHSHSTKEFQLDTNITEDGYKLFQLTFPPKDTELRLPSEQRGNRNSPGFDLSDQLVMSILEQALKENHYCREGFTLLGRYGGETTNRVRGECREKATDADRQTYINTIERW